MGRVGRQNKRKVAIGNKYSSRGEPGKITERD